MSLAALPSLIIVTVLQMVLAVCLAYVALKASIIHQRAADLYSGQLRLRQSMPTETVPISFLKLASREAADADKSFVIALSLSFGIVVLAGFQLWFAWEARRDPQRRVAP